MRSNRPCVAIAVDASGDALAEAMNDIHADCTGHAELVAVRKASSKFSPMQLCGTTLYPGAEPCAMCAGAIWRSGIGRVAYALSAERLLQPTGNDPENATLSLPRSGVLACGQRDIEVVGPLLEEETEVPHRDFWRQVSIAKSWRGGKQRSGLEMQRHNCLVVLTIRDDDEFPVLRSATGGFRGRRSLLSSADSRVA